MQLSFVFIALIGIALVNASYPDFSENDEDAMEFLNSQKRELEMAKRVFYSGKEQRREVRERYEEKCERNIISGAMNKPRWCPELDTWPEWKAAEGQSNLKNLKNKLG
ncbi:unnamed protein product [Brachionus calyciflorus]|uniref:Uncharacterized protein n=1 Tax=Brachionus calyciflorus TaxID=104777 RepID=A0A813YWJ9_9BILA|nr:unnamed protein product [Brachionus calyciflorus]